MRQNELDSLIDGGLRAYVRPAGRAEFGARVLERIRSGRRRRVWLWAGAAIAACAAWFSVAAWDETRPLKTIAAVPRPIIAIQPQREPEPYAVHAAARRVNRLTPQQRLLLSFVVEHPDEARAAAERLSNPIAIDEIRIEPLAGAEEADTGEEENR
jgi:hypothetical protein